MAKKIKKVTLTTPVGERELYFQAVPNVDKGEVICKTRCPHGKYCCILPDPTDLTNKRRKFSDFCGELSDNDAEYLDMIPVEGCVETLMNEICGEDIFKTIIKNNHLVNLKDVINTVCSGFCDEYSPDLVNCNSKNCSCILKSLLKGKDLTESEIIGENGVPDGFEEKMQEIETLGEEDDAKCNNDGI